MIHIFTHSLSGYKRETNAVFNEFDDRFEAVFFTGDKLDEFEEGLFKSIDFHRSIGLIYAAFSALGALLVLIGIGAINIYEEFFEQIVLKREFSLDYENIVSILATLFVVLVVTLLPSLGENESNAVNRLLKAWFNGETRRSVRLRRAILKLNKPLHIYSPDTVSTYDMQILFGAIKPLNLAKNEIYLHVRNEGLATIKNLLSLKDMPVKHGTDKLDPAKIVKLFDPNELVMFELASLASVKSGKVQILPIDLLEILAANLLNSNNQIGGFLHRSFDEYALLTDRFQGRSELVVTTEASEKIKGKVEFFIRSNLENIAQSLHEPLGLYRLYEHAHKYEILHIRQIWLLKNLINAMNISGSYRVLALPLLKEGLEFETLNNELSTSVLKSLDVASLEGLLEALKRSGRFEDAMRLNLYLSPLEPIKYELSRAILLERMGRFDDALNIMQNIDESKLTDNLKLLFYERFAWLIVSARLDSEHERGLYCVRKFERILQDQKESVTPSRLWNLNNILANYHEWAGELDIAGEFHQKALKIPAISQNEYAASLLNYSIILRMKFLATNDGKELEKALEYALYSIEYKQNLGDLDESAIVLHNIALHLFYGITHAVFERERSSDMLNFASRALAVLDATGSNKKLGIILIENIAASEILGLDTSEFRQRLSQIKQLGDEAAIDDIGATFKTFMGRELI